MNTLPEAAVVDMQNRQREIVTELLAALEKVVAEYGNVEAFIAAKSALKKWRIE